MSAETLRPLSRVFGTLRAETPDIQPRSVEILLAVAEEPGLPIVELQNRFGLPSATISRYIAALRENKGHGEAGMGLVETRESATDRRVREVHLTDAGARLTTKLGRLAASAA